MLKSPEPSPQPSPQPSLPQPVLHGPQPPHAKTEADATASDAAEITVTIFFMTKSPDLIDKYISKGLFKDEEYIISICLNKQALILMNANMSASL
jgi:hypothetical protein